MGLIEILVLAVGLSMDAFAVSVCKGLAVSKMKPKHALICGVYFGGFQALMPLIGYFIGAQFYDLITKFSHWIAFGLLVIIGGNMIREALSKGDEEECNDNFSPAAMLPMAVATSIDALAVGVALSMSLGDQSIFTPVILIGVTTFLLSAIGVKIGNVFGDKYKSKAELAGGVVLILLGIKLLLDGLGFSIL